MDRLWQRRGSRSEPGLMATVTKHRLASGELTPHSAGASGQVIMSWEQKDIDNYLQRGGGGAGSVVGGSGGGGGGGFDHLLTTPAMSSLSRGGSVRSVRSGRKVSVISTISSRSSQDKLSELPSAMSPPSPGPGSRSNTLGVPPSHKPSVPINLQPYVSEALETASEHIGRTPNLTNISLVKANSSEGNLTGQPSPNEPRRRKSSVLHAASAAAAMFRRKKSEDETAIVFAFDDGPKIAVTPADGVDRTNSMGLETEGDKDNSEDSGITFDASHGSNGNMNQDGGGSEPKLASSNSLSILDKVIAEHTLSHHRDDDARSAFGGSYAGTKIGGSQYFTGAHTSERSSEEEHMDKLMKKQRFWDFLNVVMSLIYAIALVVFGFLFYMADIFVYTPSGVDLSSCFNIYLCVVGSAWIIWLSLDIRSYTNTMKDYEKKHNSSLNRMTLVEGENGQMFISIPVAKKAKRLPEYYCFATDRHSGSFFLKCGAALFCVGHLVFVGLQLGREIVYYLEEDVRDCASTETLIFYILEPFFIFLQLFLIFKYSNVIVNRNKSLARYALMHCIASSLCIWMYTIKNETIDSIVQKTYFYESYNCTYEDGSPKDDDHDDHDRYGGFFGSRAAADTFGCYEPDTVTCIQDVDDISFEWDITCRLANDCQCSENNDIAKFIFDIAPYLYPFSIEYSILVVAIWYIMWSNIGNVEEHKRYLQLMPAGSFEEEAGAATSAPKNDALFLYADCHSTMKGLFFGLSFVVMSIIGIIVFFVLSNSTSCENQDVSDKVNDGFEICMMLIMIGVALWVYRKLAGLDVNPHPISMLDDLLLYICVPSFFLYAVVHILPIIDDVDDEWSDMLSDILMVIQMLIQTPMIMDGLRRCSDSADKQDRKPGRNLVVFLLVANLAIYFWETMEIKNVADQTERKEFYGVTLWVFLSHVSLPLCIFYRFHAAVALADIWGSAYQPGDHH